jgi:predicted secreted protein
MRSSEVIVRLDAAVNALGGVDVSELSDDALREEIAELSQALCRVDEHLARLADAIRARGYAIVEQQLASV